MELWRPCAARPKFDQPKMLLEIGRSWLGFGRYSAQRPNCPLSRRSRPGPVDGVGTSKIGFAAKSAAGKAEYRPNPSLGLPYSSENPADETSGQPSTASILDILKGATPKDPRAPRPERLCRRSDRGAELAPQTLQTWSRLRPSPPPCRACSADARASPPRPDLHRRWERWRGPPLGMAMGRWRETPPRALRALPGRSVEHWVDLGGRHGRAPRRAYRSCLNSGVLSRAVVGVWVV